MLIKPRHRPRFVHPTIQPIHSMKHRTTVIVRISDAARTAAEYRESSSLLRSLGMDAAADLLDATAAKLESRAVSVPRVDTLADTVIADVDHTMTLEMPAW